MKTGRVEKYKNEILMPKPGKLISEYSKEVADVLKDSKSLFYRRDSKEIVEIGKIKQLDSEDFEYTGFISMEPSRFITVVEEFLTPGIMMPKKGTTLADGQFEFKSRSMGVELSRTVLESDILQKALPQINRIFTIPIPIVYKGELTFPKKGYDVRFGSWLPYDAPELSYPEMTLVEARQILKDLFSEFCFQTKEDYTNAVSALLTPYLRGLFTSFNTRTPVFFYLANRERAGKDYLAGITGIVYEGHNLEESPLCNSERNGNNTDELRKKILAALIHGRKRMHFSNNKGFIDNAVFEAVTTAEKYSDRVLGRNEILTFDNELDFSLSGNIGVGFTPDFANRCRFIRLFLDIENANLREFKNPQLHNWVTANREKIISALYALVRNWRDKGSPVGTVPFASFSQWAAICGGIMESAGYPNPCIPDKGIVSVAGDIETTEMKKLFETCYEKYKEIPIKKSEILNIITDAELFPFFDFNTKTDQMKFSTLLTRFEGRVLSDIRLILSKPNEKATRKEYTFTKQKKEKILIDFDEPVKLEEKKEEPVPDIVDKEIELSEKIEEESIDTLVQERITGPTIPL
jgi:hypothetical protein